MENNSRRATIRLGTLALIAFTVGLTMAHASIVEPTATLPPPTGGYTLPTTCLTQVCLENISISGFQDTSDTLSGGNELVDTTAVFFAAVYKNSGGSPGTFLGDVSITGTADFTFFGRSLTIPLGTFNAQLTSFDFLGTFNGNPFDVMQNPSDASTGQTTIVQVSPGQYMVTSFFDIFAELSLDGGPFVPGPERTSDLSGLPEPGSTGLAGLGLLLGLAGLTLRRRRNSASIGVW